MHYLSARVKLRRDFEVGAFGSRANRIFAPAIAVPVLGYGLTGFLAGALHTRTG